MALVFLMLMNREHDRGTGANELKICPCFHSSRTQMRIIGVSATIQNAQDIANWLSLGGTRECETRLFDDKYRPVPLKWVVETYPVRGVMFQYDSTLCNHLFSVILKHSGGRPALFEA